MRQRVIRRVIDNGHRGGFFKAERVGNRKDAGGRRNRKFRESAAMSHGGHAIAGLEISNAFADRIHYAGRFGAGDKRKRRLDLVFALDLQNIEEIEGAGFVLDSDFSGLGRRLVDIVQHHRLRLAPSVYAPGFHKLGPSVAAPPSTTRVSPVVPMAWAAKNKVASATSAGLASLRRGVIFSASSKAESGQPAKRVRMNPGSTAFTRISGASARASDLVSVTIAPFEAA